MQARRAWWEGEAARGQGPGWSGGGGSGLGRGLGGGWGCPPRGELPFAPQLALESLPNPEEGGQGQLMPSTPVAGEAPRWLARCRAGSRGWLRRNDGRCPGAERRGGPALPWWGGSVGGGGSDPTEPPRLTPSPGGPPRHWLWCNLLCPRPVALPRCVCGWGRGVTCPPSSPAQGSSSKAWHRLSFLQNIHHHHNNNINNNIVAIAGLGRGPGVRAGRAAPTRGRGVCWPPPGHGAAGPLVVRGGRRAGRSAAPGS